MGTLCELCHVELPDWRWGLTIDPPRPSRPRPDATAADRQRPEFKGRGLAVRARLGGFTTRFLFAR